MPYFWIAVLYAELYIHGSVSKLPSRAILPDDSSQFTIIVNNGTYVEEYAKKFGIKFVDLKDHNSEEATLSNVDLNSTEQTTESAQKNDDCDKDVNFTPSDALKILKYIISSIDEIK